MIKRNHPIIITLILLFIMIITVFSIYFLNVTPQQQTEEIILINGIYKEACDKRTHYAGVEAICERVDSANNLLSEILREQQKQTKILETILQHEILLKQGAILGK